MRSDAFLPSEFGYKVKLLRRHTRWKLKSIPTTLGIEEEFQLIDPETRELRSHIQEIIEGGKIILKEHLKAERCTSQSSRLGTGICSDARAARAQVVQLRSELAAVTARRGLRIASRRHASVFTLDGSAYHVA
jgi:hypothetical protein